MLNRALMTWQLHCIPAGGWPRCAAGNPYLVPGVQLLIDNFIKDSVLRPFTVPDGQALA